MSIPDSGPPRHRGRSSAAIALLVVLLVAAMAVLAVVLMASMKGGPGEPLSGTTTRPAPGRLPAVFAARWLHVLSALDARRAAAWSTGQLSRLDSVYVPGSAELARDRQTLRSYRRRGLVVTGVDLSFFVLAVDRTRPDEVSLLVVDRLGPAVAHDESGHALPLPRDLPTRHRIVLRNVDGGWRIASISFA